MFFAFSPFAISRACVAVRKLRTMSSWQVLHSSEPTNSAPGMLGGARIVRFVVLQESKITASATAPPAPHKKVSRLTWTHRVSLETHTNREYAQNQKIITTHFFRFLLPDCQNFGDVGERHVWPHGIASVISRPIS